MWQRTKAKAVYQLRAVSAFSPLQLLSSKMSVCQRSLVSFLVVEATKKRGDVGQFLASNRYVWIKHPPQFLEWSDKNSQPAAFAGLQGDGVRPISATGWGASLLLASICPL